MNRQRLRATLIATTVAIALGVPRAAFACPVCFGASDSAMAVGMNNGILALLLVTFGVLASFGAFFIYLMRRARSVRPAPVLAQQSAEQGGNG